MDQIKYRTSNAAQTFQAAGTNQIVTEETSSGGCAGHDDLLDLLQDFLLDSLTHFNSL